MANPVRLMQFPDRAQWLQINRSPVRSAESLVAPVPSTRDLADFSVFTFVIHPDMQNGHFDPLLANPTL
jgi:hypothetical protein